MWLPWRRKYKGSGLSSEDWKRMTMDPVEREARMLAKVWDGDEEKWKSRHWEAYTRCMERWMTE